MKLFRFRARQGQEQQIASVLVNQLGLLCSLVPQRDRHGRFVLVNAVLTQHSKKQVARALFAAGVAGQHEVKNRVPILSENKLWDGALYEMNAGDIFRLARDGKLVKCQVVDNYPGCTCCGPSRSWEAVY
jgi:hypothetical protein